MKRMRRVTIVLTLTLAVAALAAWVVQGDRTAAEQGRIAELLEIGPGSVVADVGGGQGEWTVDLARRVGAGGHVYATEVDPDRLEEIQEAVEEAGLDNVTVLEGSDTGTNLPPACCDAILLRRVYHHFVEPGEMVRSMLETLRPGGRILVIDFQPGTIDVDAPDGAPERRGGHGTPTDQLLEEMTAGGFEVVERADDWWGRDYAVLFSRPRPPEMPDDGLYGVVDGSWAEHGLWDDGRAELDLYDARIDRESALRDQAYVAHVVVKEAFTPDLLVKADDWQTPGNFDVLKLNAVSYARTGLYDWHETTSSFVVRDSLVPVKMTFGRQEWCGNIFKEWRRFGGQRWLHVSSYFDGTGTRQREHDLADRVVPHDALPVLLRALRFDELHPGRRVDFPLLPTLRGRGAGPVEPVAATLIAGDAVTVDVPMGRFEARELSLEFEGRGGDRVQETWWIETAHPNRLLRWETDAGERMELARSERLEYWRMSGDDESWFPAAVWKREGTAE